MTRSIAAKILLGLIGLWYAPKYFQGIGYSHTFSWAIPYAIGFYTLV